VTTVPDVTSLPRAQLQVRRSEIASEQTIQIGLMRVGQLRAWFYLHVSVCICVLQWAGLGAWAWHSWIFDDWA